MATIQKRGISLLLVLVLILGMIPSVYAAEVSTEPSTYGVVYCALRGKEKSSDGMVDVMVRAEDASKINRIVERFKLATVDTASIKHDIEKSRAEKETAPTPPEQAAPQKDAEDLLLDEQVIACQK